MKPSEAKHLKIGDKTARVEELEAAVRKLGKCRYCGGHGKRRDTYESGSGVWTERHLGSEQECGACCGTGLREEARKVLA